MMNNQQEPLPICLSRKPNIFRSWYWTTAHLETRSVAAPRFVRAEERSFWITLRRNGCETTSPINWQELASMKITSLTRKVPS